MKYKKYFLALIAIIILVLVSLFLLKKIIHKKSVLVVYNGFVAIKGADVIIGSPVNEFLRNGKGDIEDQKRVTIKDFWLSQYEVTQKEYLQIMGNNPSSFLGDNIPVHNVTWYEAIQFCNKKTIKEGLTPVYKIIIDTTDKIKKNHEWINLEEYLKIELDDFADGYRLPTSAEWEYACRAGTKTPFSTGKRINTMQANYSGRESFLNDKTQGFNRKRPIEVGTFEPNEWMLFDMHGNIAEWCQDDYPSFEGVAKITRGGSWESYASDLRSAHIGFCYSLSKWNDIGFRLARTSVIPLEGTSKNP